MSRPKPLHVSKSFTRLDTASVDTSPRKRASTLHSPGIIAVPEPRSGHIPLDTSASSGLADVFENYDDHQEGDTTQDAETEIKLPSTIDDLPVEIKSLTERFLDGLLAKVHPAPLSADQLSQKYQDFYERAANQINIHIASLISKIGRPQPGSSRSSIKGRSRAGSGAKRADSPASTNSGGEMLTPSEVTDRRRARRILELKRIALEETVERCVCERLYDRLWKHRSTDDDARDGKLRSRTAALSVVGIGLKELHTDSDASSQQARQVAAEKEADISISLEAARKSLQQMDNEQYPLGKLQHLTAAHKGIVETLSAFFPSSSSADEILPTLIYALITTPPETINVVSNLCYIQRFRGADKVDGEAAYCLVNLEAAISFLETVDLSSLRADELPEGPPKSGSRPETPVAVENIAPMMEHSPKPDISPVDKSSLADPVTSTATVTARPEMHQRSISAMMQAQANKLEAGRDNFLNTADRVYDNLAGTLENSIKSVFGRFKDQVGTAASPLPKTLDDARRLISPPPADEDELLASGRSTPSATEDPLRLWPDTESKALDLIAGRRQLRDHSADSTKSGGSGKRVAFAPSEGASSSSLNRLLTPQEPLSGAASFITSMNPLNRFGVPSFPRFGRGTPTSPRPSPISELTRDPDSARPDGMPPTLERVTSHASDAGDDLNAREALAELRKVKPPKKRFLDISSAAELRVGDIDELLREYKRLAKAIGEAIAT